MDPHSNKKSLSQTTIASFFRKPKTEAGPISVVVPPSSSDSLSKGMPLENYKSSHQSVENIESISTAQFPDVWTREIWSTKLETYPWLICSGGKLGCATCAEVKQLSAFKSQGVILVLSGKLAK